MYEELNEVLTVFRCCPSLLALLSVTSFLYWCALDVTPLLFGHINRSYYLLTYLLTTDIICFGFVQVIRS